MQTTNFIARIIEIARIIFLILLLSFSNNAVAKMKRVYKFMVTDHRGNKWVEYSVKDPMHYVRVNGGFALIKEVRILDYRHIKVNSSLYCKNIKQLKSWKPKDYAIREVFGKKAIDKKIKPSNVDRKIPRLSSASPPTSSHRLQSVGKSGEKAGKQNPKSWRHRLQTEKPKSRIVKIRLHSFDRLINSLAKSSDPEVLATLATSRRSDHEILATSATNRKSEPEISATSATNPVKRQLNEKILKRVKRYEPLIARAATKHNLNQNLLWALVYVESSGNRLAISPKKAMGLTQLTYRTAKAMNVKNVFDPEQNLMGGAKYLSLQIKSFGNERDALAAYNAGPSRARRSLHKMTRLPRETRNYIDKVLKVKSVLDDREKRK